MPAKTPIYLKTTTPKKGKKLKLRDVLSGNMISPPLGDVRHSAHVGPEGEGDMFGDVGFLQGKMDMLPGTGRAHSRSHSVEGRAEGDPADGREAHSYAYNGYHYQHAGNGLLNSTISMPAFIAHEQAPPKPPRLHLDEHAAAPPPHAPYRQAGPSWGGGELGRRLVPSCGSFSEASSEDSASEGCGPLDLRPGLSLDSDAALSNEDLRSDRSESPCGGSRLHPASTGVSRSNSMSGLDLDLGPSILEDVLSIMDRYKNLENRCEL